ncbi:MAG: bifunctional metallophosphatase/5'-nucleotidase [Microcoleaceae cyanobacterium]
MQFMIRQSLLIFILLGLILSVVFFRIIPAQSAQTKTITILETSDLHGNLMPWDYFANQPAEWGLARIVTLVQQERAKNPNLLLIDDGDTIQGTPLANYYNEVDTQSPHPIAEAFNVLGFDAVTLGNHDFDFGVEVLSRWTQQLQAPVLCANVVKPSGEPAYLPYLIKSVNGVKVGILGLTTTGVTNWLPASNFGQFSFTDPVATAQKYVPQMRAEGADVIVIAQHTGWAKAPKQRSHPTAWLEDPKTWVSRGSTTPGENVTIELAQRVPGVDVILAGHSHLNVPQAVVNDVLIAEPSYWGKALSKFTIQLQQRDKVWKVISKTATNLSVEGVEPAKDFVEQFQMAHQQTLDYINQPIGQAKGQFVGGMAARLHNSPLASLINTVQSKAAAAAGYPVDFAITSIFRNQGELPAGEITLRHAYGVYIYDNRLFVLEITGEILRQALEHNAAYFQQIDPQALKQNSLSSPREVVAENQRSYNWDLYSEIDYTIDVTRPLGQRVTRLKFRGKPVTPEQTFRVALNNYRALGGGGYSMFKQAKVIWQSTQEIRELVAAHIAQQATLDPKDYTTDNFQLIPDLYQYFFRCSTSD